jgi:hypothetical protein
MIWMLNLACGRDARATVGVRGWREVGAPWRSRTYLMGSWIYDLRSTIHDPRSVAFPHGQAAARGRGRGGSAIGSGFGGSVVGWWNLILSTHERVGEMGGLARRNGRNVWGKFLVLGSWFRVPSSEFRVPSGEFRVPSSKLQVAGFGFFAPLATNGRAWQSRPTLAGIYDLRSTIHDLWSSPTGRLPAMVAGEGGGFWGFFGGGGWLGLVVGCEDAFPGTEGGVVRGGAGEDDDLEAAGGGEVEHALEGLDAMGV